MHGIEFFLEQTLFKVPRTFSDWTFGCTYILILQANFYTRILIIYIFIIHFFVSQATIHVVASGNQLIQDCSRLHSQEAFLASSGGLKTAVADLKAAVTSKGSHSDVISRDRKGLRDFSDQTVITG